MWNVSLRIFPKLWCIVLETKTSREGIYEHIMKQMWWILFSKPFHHILHSSKTHNFVFVSFKLGLHTSRAILWNRCEHFVLTLSVLLATLSMAIISMRTELVSSRRVYNVYFLTWRNSYKPSLGMLPPILMPLKKHKYHECFDNKTQHLISPPLHKFSYV